MVVERLARYKFHRSDLVGGHVVLDLANTVTGRDSRPTDWLEDYERVVEWAALTDSFDGSALHTLERMRTADARAATRALNRLRELREAVYQLVIAAVRGEPPPEHAVANLERRWKQAVGAAKLAFFDRRTALTLDVKSCGLDYPTHLLALLAFELLQGLPLERTRECANPPCTSIFIDRSRGGQRRWCDMKTCGNQVKSRRYYARHR